MNKKLIVMAVVVVVAIILLLSVFKPFEDTGLSGKCDRFKESVSTGMRNFFKDKTAGDILGIFFTLAVGSIYNLNFFFGGYKFSSTTNFQDALETASKEDSLIGKIGAFFVIYFFYWL